jgi:hypothetical protein
MGSHKIMGYDCNTFYKVVFGALPKHPHQPMTKSQFTGYTWPSKEDTCCGASSAQVHGQSQTELLTRISGIVQPTWLVSATQNPNNMKVNEK